MRVLVVDDYPGAADVVCVLIRMLGHEACPASSGSHAVAEAIAFEPDVIVLDLGLPDIDGHEVARRVRERLGERPFIAAMTGWDHREHRVQAVAAGINLHVLKPASEESLLKIFDTAQEWFTTRDAARP